MVQLPLQSITMGCKQEKAKLVMKSTDQSVRDVYIRIRTGRKWKGHAEADQAISRLQQKVVIGRVQAGRAGLEIKIKAVAQGHQGNVGECSC